MRLSLWILSALITFSALVDATPAQQTITAIGTITDDEGTPGDGTDANGEARCDVLGSNCICAESWDTDTVVNSSGYKNPANSTSKTCSFEGSGSPAYTLLAAVAANDSTVLNALPAGHSVGHYYRGPEGHLGTFWFGAGDLSTSFNARVAIRFYQYLSSNFDFDGPKLMSVAGVNVSGPHFSFPGLWHFYGLDGYTYNGGAGTAGDCCTSGPPMSGGSYSHPTSMQLLGKWWRFEIVVENRAGGSSPNGIRYRLYGRNVTDGTDEVAILDSGVTCPTCGPSNAHLGWDDLTPPSAGRADRFDINYYRQADPGPVDGYRAMSHMLFAGWTTNAGQRIASAYEVEGAQGEINP